MQTGVRISAALFRVEAPAYESMAGQLGMLDEVEYDGRTLRIWHEAPLADPEGLLRALAERCGPECGGGMDVIDHDEWEVTRYTVENGKIESRTISLNEVLEGKSDEWGA